MDSFILKYIAKVVACLKRALKSLLISLKEPQRRTQKDLSHSPDGCQQQGLDQSESMSQEFHFISNLCGRDPQLGVLYYVLGTLAGSLIESGATRIQNSTPKWDAIFVD